jgi:hypothetical protein
VQRPHATLEAGLHENIGERDLSQISISDFAKRAGV